MFVTHPSEVELPHAPQKQNSGGRVGARRRPGATPGKRKARGGRERGSRLAPSIPASAVGGGEGQARATPSPGRVSAGVASATTACETLLGTVLGAPLAHKCTPVPVTATSRQRKAGVEAGAPQAEEGGPSAPNLRLLPCRQGVAGPRPHRPMYGSSGSSPSTAPPPGGWQGPFRLRSHLLQKAAERKVRCVAAGPPGTPRRPG